LEKGICKDNKYLSGSPDQCKITNKLFFPVKCFITNFYIALVYDENHKEETAYEMYQAPNSAVI
jgi:hypothetical protein